MPRPTAGPATGTRHDLQGVRGLAVLGVVVYHLRASWLPGGFAGVDVFFVMSGFFITGLLLRELDRRRSIDLLAFWGRRARRLLPASLLVLVTTVLAGYALTNPLEAHRIARDGLYSTIFAMNWHEAARGIAYGQDPNPSPFQHYWSLGVEGQFYLVWPVLLIVLAVVWRTRARLSPRRTLVALAVPVAVLSFVLASRQTAGNQPYAYYGTFGRVWQLAVGGLLAAAVGRLDRLPVPIRLVSRVAGFALIIGFYAAAPSVGVYPGGWALLPTAGAALIVVAGEPPSRREPVAWMLTSRLGQLGGRYSYSWYLWHWAPLVLLPIMLDRPLRIRELGWCAIATLLLAVATFHLLEDPIRRHRALDRRHSARSLQLGVALMIVALGISEWTAVAARHTAARTRVVTNTHHTLTPQPGQAAKEEPAVATDGCQLPATSTAFAPDCRYLPDRGHGDIVLVGDSHAAMWSPAVQQAATENGWGLRVWARTSCPFADVRKSVTGTGEYASCDRWRADVIQRLIKTRPSLVIVANYAQVGLHVTDPRTGAGASQALAHQLFQAGLQRNLARLRAAGLNVLLIRDPPAYTAAAPDCALTHADRLAVCSLPENAAIPFGGVDLKAAQAVSGVHVADFTDAFCHDGRCYQVIQDTLAYRDVNHLTIEMALRLESRLAASVRAALG